MIRKLIVLCLILNSSWLLAQNSNEEAIILNQEMQFLEDSISNVQAAPSNSVSGSGSDENAIESSLERTYFSDSEKDTIRTRTAAPERKRRSF